MRFSWPRILLFTAAAGVVVYGIWWLDHPGGGDGDVDRHTGLAVRTPKAPTVVAPEKPPEPGSGIKPPGAPLLRRAWETGDARVAIDVLKAASADMGAVQRQVADRLVVLLRAEVEEPATPPDPDRLPWARGKAPSDPVELAEALQSMEPATDVGPRVERFFRPLVARLIVGRRDVLTAAEKYWPADQVAALALQVVDGDADAVDPEVCLAVARAFQAAGRGKGRFRWLLRAYRKAPGRTDVVEAISQSYVEFGRTQEGHAVVSAAVAGGLDDERMLRLLLRMALWNSDMSREVEVRERLLALGEDWEMRRRLVHLYPYLGRPREAVRHAEVLGEGTGRVADFELAARIALSSGDLENGYRLLELAGKVAGDPTPYREQIAEVAFQDLDFERAISESERLFAEHPDEPRHEARLEGFLRMRGNLPRLVQILEARLARAPHPQLEYEVLGMHHVLGNTDKVAEMALRQLARQRDPVEYFWLFITLASSDVPGLRERAAETTPRLTFAEGDVDRVVNSLEPYLRHPTVRSAVRRIIDRLDPQHAFELRLRLVDVGTGPAEAAKAAELLANAYPNSPEAARLWIERTAWADLPEMQAVARERLARLDPNDLDNRTTLAELHEGATRLADAEVHWRYVAARRGPSSTAAARLVEILFTQGRLEEATAWLDRMAGVNGVSVEDRRELAEQFFRAERSDRALQIYESIVKENPDDPDALKRIGQIRSWSNDPRGAIPYLERSLEVSGPGDGEILFLLGEAYLSVQRADVGEPFHEDALPLLRAWDPPTVESESMVGKILARLGRLEESKAIYERLVAENPENRHLPMDFADAMMAGGDLETAREAVERARPGNETDRRLLRLEGVLLIEEGRYAEAIPVLWDRIEFHGPNAGVYSDLGRAYELGGHQRSAVYAYSASLGLQPDSVDVARSQRNLWDKVTSVAEFSLRGESVGDDSTFWFDVEASVLDEDERTRFSGTLRQAYYSGRAAAVDDGLTDVTEEVTTLSVSAVRTSDDDTVYGGGLLLHAGRSDGTPVGLWGGIRWDQIDPVTFVSVRGHLGEIFGRPAAAAGLGGTSHGLALQGYRDMTEEFGDRWWTSGLLSFESLSIDTPNEGGVTTSRTTLALVAGYRFQERQPRAEEAVRARELTPVELGSTVEGDEEEELDPAYSIWGTVNAIRLGDGEMADLIPIGEKFTYVTLSGQAAYTLAPGITGEVEGYVGTDLENSGLFFGLRAAASYRSDPDLEVRGELTYGQAFGLEGDSTNSLGFEIAVVLRW